VRLSPALLERVTVADEPWDCLHACSLPARQAQVHFGHAAKSEKTVMGFNTREAPGGLGSHDEKVRA
jgi:hypothetical protein